MDALPWVEYYWVALGEVYSPCTDTPPDPQYTCAQQASWGKCNETWMAGHCCVSCFNCSTTCRGLGELGPWCKALCTAGSFASAASPSLLVGEPFVLAVFGNGMDRECKWGSALSDG